MIMLGFDPCYHMFEIIKSNGALEPVWEKALKDPKNADWDRIFGADGGYRAAVDFPASAVYDTLMEKYPKAKVVLSVRDAKGWVKSVRETIWSPYHMELSLACAPWHGGFRRMCQQYRKYFHPNVGKASDAQLVEAFDNWTKRVQETVPKERLLVHRAQDGWAPLCEFLGVPTPSEPYPNVNDSNEFKARLSSRWKVCMMKNTAIVVGALAVATGAAYGCFA
eukprot:NODE_2554_length_915_cov_284.801163.p1 GENE.NODE_2554_length_915_cov_284.801163~~NODE_2554_length_915_cov_284.801163.p1  ORF type:complete len:251 (+),score=74.33 NODE_2554_length_915_cov_284.801163:88-753(+)